MRLGMPSCCAGVHFPTLVQPPSPTPLHLPASGERIFSAIDEAGAKVPVTDRSLFVSGNMFFRLWRFYGNHKKTTPNASPLPIALFVFAPRRWLSARGFSPGAAQRQPGFVATPPHPRFGFSLLPAGWGRPYKLGLDKRRDSTPLSCFCLEKNLCLEWQEWWHLAVPLSPSPQLRPCSSALKVRGRGNSCFWLHKPKKELPLC